MNMIDEVWYVFFSLNVHFNSEHEFFDTHVTRNDEEWSVCFWEYLHNEWTTTLNVIALNATH